MGRDNQIRQIDPSCYRNIEGQFSLRELKCADFIRTANETTLNNSIIGLAGKDFAFVAISVSNEILKDQALKRVACRLVLASTGSPCDTGNLASLLRARLYMNEFIRQRVMKSRCVALLLSCLLTNGAADLRNTSYMIAGLDDHKNGVIYAYDLLGYHEKTKYRAIGRAKVFLQNYLNGLLRPRRASTVSNEENTNVVTREADIDADEALGIIINAFRLAMLCNKIPNTNKIVISGVTKRGVCLEEIQF